MRITAKEQLQQQKTIMKEKHYSDTHLNKPLFAHVFKHYALDT